LAGYPLTVEKFISWVNNSWQEPLINLFMDYETFGEHQWADTGIFQFLEALPGAWLRGQGHTFMTVSKPRTALKRRTLLTAPKLPPGPIQCAT